MLTVKGYAKKEIYSKGDYKIYSFYPVGESRNIMHLDVKYGNTSINGVLPTLSPNVEYTLDVEYVQNGKYHNYKVLKVHNNFIKNDSETVVKLLSSFTSVDRAKTIVSVYPDIIQRVMNNEEISVDKLHNIGKKTLNKIKKRIVEDYQLLGMVDEYAEYGMTFNMMKNLYEHYKSVDLIKEKMADDPYTCLCHVNRVGFKTADGFIMAKYPHKMDSQERGFAAMRFLLKENEENGNTWIGVQELLVKYVDFVPECKKHFVNVIKDSEDIFYDKTYKRVAMKTTIACEYEIVKLLMQLLKAKVEPLKVDYNKYKTVNGVELSEEQLGLLDMVNNNSVSILAGFGGSGKSFSMKALVNMMNDCNVKILPMATTGKATKVLADYVQLKAKTIHRGLKYKPKGKEGKFEYNEDNKLPHQLVIVDEYSMMDIFLLRSLLRAIEAGKTRVLFVGDPAQIPSVGVGNVAYDMLNSGVIPTTLLTKVFRYDEGGLSYVATQIREGKKYLENDKAIQSFGTNKDYVFINTDQEDIIRYFKHVYNNLLKKGYKADDIMVLSAYNTGSYGTITLNREVQDMINPGEDLVKAVRNGEVINFRPGDKIMQIKNTYSAVNTDGKEDICIFNGDIGVVANTQKDSALISINNENVLYDSADHLSQLDLAYAMSIHKSQGSAAKAVILLTPRAHKFFLNRNLMYVAASRAKEVLWHIGSTDVVNSALRKSSNANRNTYLLYFLQNYKTI